MAGVCGGVWVSNRPLLEIRNLKSIQHLEFPIPKSGTWLLTGANGVGKSALLTCLYRINYKDAFRDHFPSSSISRRLVSFENAQVSYQVNKSRVAYRRNRHRWVPRPRSQASLLRKIGFNGVVHIGATADRITPKPEDFNPARSRSANQRIIDLANEVFNTNRFSNLRVVNVTRGVNEAFVIRKGHQSPYDYFGEKLLSVGELCVLKLLKRVLALPSQSLILIDELEIALHPTAQARLFSIISRLTSEGNHTAIFSTHSATLLKLSKQNQIL
ncbi:AAA family ATPase [Nioella aestuarii]|uniref:AAA family ATPase n=1 Tax=Nioella aestuarii TaxID=1662864 RepID=UPI003D7FEE32